jgi:DNA-binding LacI/PurR family transcriptional regulator
LESAGLRVQDDYVKLGSNWNTLGEMATNELLQLQNRPTAVFVASNAIMPGVMRTFQQFHVQIPDDVSVICFDDLDWFAFSVPPITAITHDHNKLAHTAVDLLMKRIHNHTEQVAQANPLFITIDFDLLLRKSTAPPAIKEGYYGRSTEMK